MNPIKIWQADAFELKVMLRSHMCCTGPLCNIWWKSLLLLGTIKTKICFSLFFQLPHRLSRFFKKEKEREKMCCTVHLSAVIMPVNCGAPLCVQFYRWLCRVSWLWPPAPAQHLPPWPEDLRLWRRKGADDCCCFCQGNYVTVLED